MIERLQKLGGRHSCFLFGARATGKTTLLKQVFGKADTLWIDLLSFKEEDRFQRNPDILSELIAETSYKRVVVDEVQKVPKILDIVHLEIERNEHIQFVLTGSSARKLRRGNANMLAGRLFNFSLHPLTHLEFGKTFCLDEALQAGTLPRLSCYKSIADKSRYLQSYIETYLKEEVLVEQLVRKVGPFRNFLEIAAQCNGQIINYSKLARQLGVDYTTVQSYFDILHDTYLGFYLRSFDRSVRKQQNKAPKFYLFDTGVARALKKQERIKLVPGSYEYGASFEHLIVLELMRLNDYFEANFQISYLRDKDGNEIDLVVRKPMGEEVLVEIKSTDRTQKDHGNTLEKFLKFWDRPCSAQVWSRDPKNRKVDNVHHYHWKKALGDIFKPQNNTENG